MINFIPKAFTGEEDSCPVCIARVQLESALEAESDALLNLSMELATTGVSRPVAELNTKLMRNFAAMSADYRVALAINLAIWFSAERYGRAKKVPDLLLAYDEYQGLLTSSLKTYKEDLAALQKLVTESAIEALTVELFTSHKNLAPSFDTFFQEVTKWTDKRRDDAFTVL